MRCHRKILSAIFYAVFFQVIKKLVTPEFLLTGRSLARSPLMRAPHGQRRDRPGFYQHSKSSIYLKTVNLPDPRNVVTPVDKNRDGLTTWSRGTIERTQLQLEEVQWSGVCWSPIRDKWYWEAPPNVLRYWVWFWIIFSIFVIIADDGTHIYWAHIRNLSANRN